MCGRYTLKTRAEEVAATFDIRLPDGLPPRYNIAPTQPILAVRTAPAGGREAALLRWGFVPSWAQPGPALRPLINARAETAATKPTFRRAFARRRCLVPADGFYEWRRFGPDGRGRQPHHFARRDGRPFALAAVWESWAPPGEAALETVALLTTTPNATLAPIHDRMPVILDRPEAWSRWLDPDLGVDDAVALCRPAADDLLSNTPVSPRVNRADRDDEACLAPAPLQEPPPEPPACGQQLLFP